MFQSIFDFINLVISQLDLLMRLIKFITVHIATLFLGSSFYLCAQNVAINTTGAVADNSAMLDFIILMERIGFN